MYNLARSLFFRVDPEKSHGMALGALDALYRVGGVARLFGKPVDAPVELMGLRFSNRVGLAAGLDKNADHLDALGALGFGFIEVGTVTPKPQPGNPKPRLFRLAQHEAIINRFGFNNKGVAHLIQQVKQRHYRGIVGINIGKNLTTPVEQALDDYLVCLDAVHPYADYIAVNVSSPNTPGLRTLQFGEQLDALLGPIRARATELNAQAGRNVPLLIKIAPDMSAEEVALMAGSIERNVLDGVIATNTTVSREAVQGDPQAEEAGGLSGKPVFEASNRVIRQLREHLPTLPIIGVGGIDSVAAAQAKIAAGADLVQLYSGLIYQGPRLVGECASALASQPLERQPLKSPHEGGLT
ncbi:quinone-dependent dihydroorotate dehydrogenase [Halovibrio sp. HP20-50]|uniref:quinone-dependent dihydroorotate dehydrogenase n=1 Tax=Halovibrio sp. HP20-59 TaxID=3080275 RepID=UPI00294B9729|nr:quinone-dependent dihydroorotate dehydrogenase [Halovibrio sp. HP20-59]MEA2118194.1 quinone-dependent dihydroorotate dehydrogenase [Halovibrio sp. HP20-59]